MTRSELVAALASRFPQLLSKDAGEAVNEILGAISRTLSAGHRVEIRGFGSFSLNYQAPRLRRNPKTGEGAQGFSGFFGHPTGCVEEGRLRQSLVHSQLN